MAEIVSSGVVQGFLHRTVAPAQDAIILTHGAGSNCESALLVALADAFQEVGFTVLRYNLPYRQQRSSGPPPRGAAERDRSGLQAAATWMRSIAPGRLFLGGHSYGGRQETMLAAGSADVADGLLLLSYPLHPPRKPEDLRTAHFPLLNVRSLFVHGTRDSFGSPDEVSESLRLIPGETHLHLLQGAGHELNHPQRTQQILGAFQSFFA